MTRMQRKRLLIAGKRIIGFNLLAGLVLAGSIYMYWLNAAVPAAAMQNAEPIAGLVSWREVLSLGIPGLADSQPSANEKNRFSASALTNDAIAFFTNIDGRDLRSILRTELPSLQLAEKEHKGGDGGLPAAAKRPAVKLARDKPLVGIYHTHTAESFIPSTGAAHRPGGQIGEICDVGAALVKTLEKNGIAAIQDTTIHDYPSFMKAYGASEVTVKRMLKEYPSLKMIFDIHRDAEKRANVVGTINGEEVAKVSIIVAQGQKDLPQPNWKQNYAMAKRIDRKLNEKYPGLSRGIQLVEWRYNQHLHPHSLILEIGSHETSVEEAVRAIEMVGEILTEILEEGDL